MYLLSHSGQTLVPVATQTYKIILIFIINPVLSQGVLGSSGIFYVLGGKKFFETF